MRLPSAAHDTLLLSTDPGRGTQLRARCAGGLRGFAGRRNAASRRTPTRCAPSARRVPRTVARRHRGDRRSRNVSRSRGRRRARRRGAAGRRRDLRAPRARRPPGRRSEPVRAYRRRHRADGSHPAATRAAGDVRRARRDARPDAGQASLHGARADASLSPRSRRRLSRRHAKPDRRLACSAGR